MSKLQITFWGGVGTVTGANFLLESDETKILVDCGLMQGTPESYEENSKPFPYNVRSINYLFITHAHMDHIGRVCKLVRDGFKGVIYSTPETRELAQVMLQDALKVMDMKEKAMIEGVREIPLYDVGDYNQTFSQWRAIPYHTHTKINDEFSVFAKDAGHILGASMYEFYHGGKKIVFTNGCFDLLHSGHIFLLNEAKKLGDKLIVLLNNDNWLQLKKGYAFMPEHERKEIIEAFAAVDRVILSKHKKNTKDISVCEEIRKIKPHIFANGGDRKPDWYPIPEVALCEEFGIKMIYNVGRGGKVRSSSELVKKYSKHLEKYAKKN